MDPRCRRARRRRLPGLLAVRPADSFDRDRRNARLLGDQAVLFFEDGAGGLIKVEAAKHRARDFAVRPLRTVLVEYVERHVFGSGCGLSGHFGSPIAAHDAWTIVAAAK